jgi:hypothetical protein
MMNRIGKRPGTYLGFGVGHCKVIVGLNGYCIAW